MSSKFSHWSLNNAPLLIITSHIVNWNIFSCNSFAFQDQDCFYLLLYVLSRMSYHLIHEQAVARPTQCSLCLWELRKTWFVFYINQSIGIRILSCGLAISKYMVGSSLIFYQTEGWLLHFFIWSCQIRINI